MTTTTIAEVKGFRGRLISSDAVDYDSARAVWNGAIDRRPRVIARCSGPADVIAAVRFARDHDLEIAIRGGGHNVAGTAVCDDGIVIDLSAMRAVRVDRACSGRCEGAAATSAWSPRSSSVSSAPRPGRPKPYAGFQGALDSTVVHGWNYYWKSTHLPELRDDLIEVIAEHAFSCSSPRSYVALFHLKGAVSRVAEGATAFGNRQASHAITLDGVWRPGEDFGDSSPPSADSRTASTSISSAATKAPSGSARRTETPSTTGSWL